MLDGRCKFGVPLVDLRDAAGPSWSLVEGLLVSGGILRCDGRNCSEPHGYALHEGDLDEILRTIECGKAPLVASHGEIMDRADWQSLRERAERSESEREEILESLRDAADRQNDHRRQAAAEHGHRTISALPSHTTQRRSPSDQKRPRPVVAIDVDGVLNVAPLSEDAPFSATEERVGGYVSYDVTLVQGLVSSPFLRGLGEESISGGIWLNPLHGEWINSLLRRGVEVAWCTVWEAHANHVVARLLGIPDLPLAVTYADDLASGVLDSFAAESPSRWKVEMLTARYAGRALVWLAMDAEMLPRNEVTLPVFVDDRSGLGLSHMQEVNTWLDSIGW